MNLGGEAPWGYDKQTMFVGKLKKRKPAGFPPLPVEEVVG